MGEYLSNKCAEVVVLHSVIADAGESDLERINPFSFYEFASKLHAVSALSGEVSTRAGFWPIWQARNAIETLIKGDPIPIGISSGKAQTLRERLDNVMKDRFETTDQKGEKRIRFPEESDQPIAGYMIDWIKSGITEFETVFAEEMRETATYFVPRRGIYWTPALVDSADETFPKELLSFIPQKAREDWKSAGRCLAFNLLSASGFHVARAVEACRLFPSS